MHSLLPKLTVRAWAWDCGSAAPLLNRTGAACGLLTTLREARDFASHYLPTARHATQLCLEIALKLLTALTFRHSLAANLRSLGVDVNVPQELLRHENSRTTMDLDTQAASANRRDASKRQVELLLA